MGVKCEILLLNNVKDVYKAGDSVEGTVKYIIDKSAEFTSVTLSVRGKGFWYWAPIASKTIYNNSESLVDQRMDLLEAKENEPVTIPVGTYEKQFCFVLPEVIPSPFKDLNICFISFFVQLEFVKPNLMSVPMKFYSGIEVQSGLTPRGKETYLVCMKKKFSLSKKTISLIAYIKKPFIYAGEDIEVIFGIIKNCSDLPLIYSKIELMQFVTYKSNITKRYVMILKGIEVKYIGINSSKTELKHILRLSTTSDMFTVHSHVLRVEYRVRIMLKLPCPHSDIFATIPVAIAEKIDNFEKEKLDIEKHSNGQAMNEKSLM